MAQLLMMHLDAVVDVAEVAKDGEKDVEEARKKAKVSRKVMDAKQ